MASAKPRRRSDRRQIAPTVSLVSLSCVCGQVAHAKPGERVLVKAAKARGAPKASWKPSSGAWRVSWIQNRQQHRNQPSISKYTKEGCTFDEAAAKDFRMGLA